MKKNISIFTLLAFGLFFFSTSTAIAAINEERLEELSKMSLEDLLNTEVEVASLSKESDLVVGSAVAQVDEEQWKKRGARRTAESINYLPSTMLYSMEGGSIAIGTRGFASDLSIRGTATLLDGVPMNTFSFGSAAYYLPNFDLATLDRVEMIRGPGSALYGSDAFHSVFSMRTFESEKDKVAAELEGGLGAYYRGGVKLSKEVFDGIRLNTAFGFSGQPGQNIPYTYPEGNGAYQNEYNTQSFVLKANSDPSNPFSFHSGIYLGRWNSNNFPGSWKIGNNLLKDKNYSGDDSMFFMGNTTFSYLLPFNITSELNGYYWQNKSQLNSQTFDSLMNPAKLLSDQNEMRTGLQILAKQPGDNLLKTQWILSYAFNHMNVNSTRNDLLSLDGKETDLPAKMPGIDAGKLPYDGLSRNIHTVFGQARTSLFRKKFHILYGSRLDFYSDLGMQFTPRAGLIYQPTEKSAIKLLYGNAFRAGVASELTYNNMIKGDSQLKPEIIRTYEMIYMQVGDNWKANIDLYRSDWQNAIASEPLANDPNFTSKYTNKGQSEAMGAEVEFQYYIGDFGFDLGASSVISKNLTTQTEYKAFPGYIFNLGVSYSLKSLNLDFFLNNRLLLGMQDSPVNANSSPTDLQPYYRPDLNITWGFMNNTRLVLNVRNIINMQNSLPSIFGEPGGLKDYGISPTLRVDWTL